MHQAKERQQLAFRHEGPFVDAKSGLVHAVIGTAVCQRRQSDACAGAWRGIRLFGDAGYQGVEKRPENQGSTADWHIAMKRGKRKAL